MAETSTAPRRTKAQVEQLRAAIYDIVRDNRPCSVRQVYYVGVGRLWSKDQKGSRRSYKRVVRELGVMRENGMVPFDWVTDATRYTRIPTMYDSIEQAQRRWAESYRRDLWSRQPRRVEVWAESDSISGVVDPVTRALGVGLFSCRGQASKTFAHSSAMTYREIRKPVTILYVGDWDPTGLAIPRSLGERLHRYAGDVEIDFRRLAVTADDLRDLDLTTHEVNLGDPNYRAYAAACSFVGLDPQVSVEVEALPPPLLRDRLERELYDLVEDAEQWNATLAAEESERDILESMIGGRS